MISLERRFVVGLAATLLAVFGFLFWGSITTVRSLAETYILARLEHDAEALLAAVWINPRGLPRLREGRITPVYQQPLSGHYFVVRFADGSRLRSRSLWDEDLEVSAMAPGQVASRLVSGPGDQQLLVRTAGYEKGGLRFTLSVGEDLAPMAAAINRFQILVLGVLGLALLAIVLIQRYLLRRGFRSFERVQDEVRQVSAGRLSQLNEPGPLEIQPLTAEVNRLLARMQQRLQRSRLALGNLAHALKGPLSLMTRDLDTLPMPDGDRKRLTGQLERVGVLVERELKRARLAGEGGGRQFVPKRDVPELLDVLRQMYRQRDIEIVSGDLPDTVLPLDQEDMLELLGNLLDNACKWARRRVDLQMSLGDELAISVSDDGPGIAEEEREALLRRGGRLDEQEPGHGLGLAIVRDLVDAYHGTLDLGKSASLGGLSVRISLPLAIQPR